MCEETTLITSHLNILSILSSILVLDNLVEALCLSQSQDELLPDVLHSITLWCTIRYRTMLMIAMSLFRLKPRLGMYFRHLELRGSLFNKSLQETGLERHFWTTRKFLKNAVKRVVGLSERVSERVSERDFPLDVLYA